MLTKKCDNCRVISSFHITWPNFDNEYYIMCDNCNTWPKLKISVELQMEYDDLIMRSKIFNKQLESYINKL